MDAAASSFLEEDEDDIVRAVVVVPFLSSEHMGVGVGVGVGDVVHVSSLLSLPSSSTQVVDPTSVPVPVSAASSSCRDWKTRSWKR